MTSPDDESDKTLPTAHNLQEASSAESAPGQVLGERYRIESVLGQGGMGTVYLATQIFLQQKIALKILDKRQTMNETNRRRFENEGKASYALNHPNLVKVLDFGLLPDQSPYFAMEYVQGVALQDLLKKERRIEVTRALEIFDQICDGLIYAHKHHVIHRDIKPSNIMISDEGKRNEDSALRVKVVDFGIAKIMNEERGEVQGLTRTGEVFGNPLYMSPEQCRGGRIDARTDIYSLGCALFESLTGTPPHVGTNALRTMMLHTSEPAPSLQEASLGRLFPAELEAIVAKMLAIDVLIASLAVLVILIATGFGAYNLVKSPSTTTGSAATVNKPVFLQDETGEVGHLLGLQDSVIKKLENAAPITTRIIEENGKKKLEIKFPDELVGMVNYKPGKNPFKESEESFEARGRRVVPLNAPLQLYAGDMIQAAILAPSIFKKFPPDLFSKLLLDKPGGYAISESTPKTVKEYSERLEQILETVQNWKKLESLGVCRMKLTSGAVHAISNMKHLKSLALWNNFGTEKDLIPTPIFTQVEALYLRFEHSDGIMEKASHSKVLKELRLESVVCTPKTYQFLSQCQSLEKLRIVEPFISKPDLDAITKAKSLKEVFFDDVSMNPKDLEDFVLNSPAHLKKIIVSSASASAARAFVDTTHKLVFENANQVFENTSSRDRLK